MFLPLAAILMIVSNIEMVARTTEKFAKEMMGQATKEVAMQAETTDIPELPTEDIQGTTLPRDKQEKEMVETQIKSVPDSVVFQVVEEMPDFPGGVQALMDYLSKNVRYPAEAHAIGAQGRVIVSFTVKKDGSIADTKVERSVNPYLDKEAMHVIAAMPKWKPGKQRGEAVNVKFTVPVAFRLSGPELPKAEEVKQSDMDEVVVVGYAAKDDPTPEGGSVKGENEDEVFTMVEVMPKFPGGQAGLFQYLARSIKYPVIAQKSKEQGRVIIHKSGKTRRAALQKRCVSKSTKTTRTRKTVSPVLPYMTRAHRFFSFEYHLNGFKISFKSHCWFKIIQYLYTVSGCYI